MSKPEVFVGAVIHGFGRGRKLGFPTANVMANFARVSSGIYSGLVTIESVSREPYGATVSISDNPTFADIDQRVMECYIHDFNEEIYGQTVRVELISRLRDEIAFDSTEDLIEQSRRDVEESRSRLTKYLDGAG